MQLIPTFPLVWTIVKLFFIIGLAVYSIFALVIVRQTQIMSTTVKLDFELAIKFLATLHLLLALGLLLFAIIAL